MPYIPYAPARTTARSFVSLHNTATRDGFTLRHAGDLVTIEALDFDTDTSQDRFLASASFDAGHLSTMLRFARRGDLPCRSARTSRDPADMDRRFVLFRHGANIEIRYQQHVGTGW